MTRYTANGLHVNCAYSLDSDMMLERMPWFSGTMCETDWYLTHCAGPWLDWRKPGVVRYQMKGLKV